MVQIGLDENTNDAYLFTTVIVEPNGEFSLDSVKPTNDLYLRNTTILDGYDIIRTLENTELFTIFKDELNTKENAVMLNGIVSYNIDRTLDKTVTDTTLFSDDFNNLENISMVDNADDITLSLNDPQSSGLFDLYPYLVNSEIINMNFSGTRNIKFAVNYGFIGAYINISNIGNTFTFKLITNSNKTGISDNISYARTIDFPIIDSSEILGIGYSSFNLDMTFDYKHSEINITLELFDENNVSMSIKTYTLDGFILLDQNTLHSWGQYYTTNLNDVEFKYRLNCTSTLLYQDPTVLSDFDYDLNYTVNYNSLFKQRDERQFSNLILNGSAKTKVNYKTSIQYHNSYTVINGNHLNIGMFDYYYSPIMNMYSIRPNSPETISFKYITSYVIGSANLVNNSNINKLTDVNVSVFDSKYNTTILNNTTKSKIIAYSQEGEYGDHEKFVKNVGIYKRLSDSARFEFTRAYKKETSIKIHTLKIICSAFSVINPKGITIQSNAAELNKEIYSDVNYDYNDVTLFETLYDKTGLMFNAIIPPVNTKLKDSDLSELLNTVNVMGLQLMLKLNGKIFPITINLGQSGKILSTSKVIPISIRITMNGGKF